jgi:hypothetical protein
MTTDHDSSTDYETLFNAAAGSAEVSVVARESAQHVVAKLLEVEKSTEGYDLTARIQAAASAGDISLIFQLTDELKELKTGEDQRAGRLTKLAEEFSFSELLQAFPAQYKALVYSVGLEAIKKIEEVRKKQKAGVGRIRTPSNVVYLITRNGVTIEAKKNAGAPKSPGAERAFFEFMGFSISDDGKLIDPPAFKNFEGVMVNSGSKKHVIEDLLSGSTSWVEKGYSIELKPS